nr:MAG TPA: hypothetical protein [Caudoviricetes sp.]
MKLQNLLDQGNVLDQYGDVTHRVYPARFAFAVV